MVVLGQFTDPEGNLVGVVKDECRASGRLRSPACREGLPPHRAGPRGPAGGADAAERPRSLRLDEVAAPLELRERSRGRSGPRAGRPRPRLPRVERLREVVGVEHRRVDRLLRRSGRSGRARGRRRATTGPAGRRRACRRRALAVAAGERGRERRARPLAGASELGRPSSSQNICARVPRQKPSPGITGEPCSQPPLGVAETALPKRSTTSTWHVSPRVGSPVPGSAPHLRDVREPRLAAARAAGPQLARGVVADEPAPLVRVRGAEADRRAGRRRRRTRPRGRRRRAWRTRRPCGRSRAPRGRRARSRRAARAAAGRPAPGPTARS